MLFSYNVSKFFELKCVNSLTLKNGTSVSGEELVNLTLSIEDKTNLTYRLEPTDVRTDPYYITIYILWMNLIFNILGPFVVLAVLNHIVSCDY